MTFQKQSFRWLIPEEKLSMVGDHAVSLKRLLQRNSPAAAVSAAVSTGVSADSGPTGCTGPPRPLSLNESGTKRNCATSVRVSGHTQAPAVPLVGTHIASSEKQNKTKNLSFSVVMIIGMLALMCAGFTFPTK